jgi:hypothetical protein
VHRGFWTLAAVLLGLGIPAGARAASLTWSAPAACPSAEEVNERVTRGLSAELASLPDIVFEAKVSRAAQGYELKLTVRKGDSVRERRIRAKTCPELVDALGAAMTLAIQSLSPADTEPATTSSSSEPSEPPAPPPPEETPPQKASPPEPGPVPAAPAKRGSTIYPSVSLGALLDVGTLPKPAVGVNASFGLTFGWLKPSVYGVLIPPERSAIHGSATEQIEFDLLAGGLNLCGSSREGWWELRGCLGGEVGRLEAVGVHVANAQRRGRLWGAIVPGAMALGHPPRQIWGPFVSVGAVLPLNRPDFGLTYEGFVHRPAALCLRVGLGIELEFR